MLNRNALYLVSIIVIIIVGIFSRLIDTGFILIDKYLGDVLYAMMFYFIAGLLWGGINYTARSIAIAILMIMIELFQLTLIPLQLSRSDNIFLRVISILLGTKFSLLDIAAYMLGVIACYLIEKYVIDRLTG